MTRCLDCQHPVAGPFCSACGTPNAPLRIVCAVSYLLGLWSLIFLLIKPFSESVNVRFHVLQAALISLSPAALAVVISVFQRQILHAPSSWLGPALGLAILLIGTVATVLVSTMISAYRGRRPQLPFVGPLAERFAGSSLLRQSPPRMMKVP